MSNQEDIAAARPGHGLLGAWLDASAHLADGVLRANRSLVSPFDAADGDEREIEEGAPGVTHTERGWTVETEFADPEAVSVGDVVEFSKTLVEDEVRAFAAASGDTNRLHLDEEYAEESRFGGTIVHGTLVSGIISAALARLPGVVVYLSQESSFLGPVEPGQATTAVCEVVEDLGGGRFRLTTDVLADGETVVEGEAVVLIEDAPE
ncbi:acyl dehydratase [Halobacteriales archaeon QS_1_68_20]|nr:MAG: acyl dehydratase [Halobacteriales archaeon QS_1_68_20]